ncbi:uncharacterized protein [Amphiura filiformis]|uniref:uncharacterized protein n=1 Tax=Amphiura filiformis TaxID=82378 RepID=UPI003B2196AA
MPDANEAGDGAAAGDAVKMIGGVKPPAQPTISNGIIDDWKLWKQAWDNYVIVSRLNKQPADYQTAMFLNVIGPQGLKIYNSFELKENSRDLASILQHFHAYAIGEVNETYERYIFNQRVQKADENFETYLASLRVLAKTCSFEPLTDSLIRDRIVLGILKDDARKLLLQERGLTLAKAISICKSCEAAETQAKAFKESVAPTAINKVARNFRKSSGTKPKPRNQATAKRLGPERDCWYCGNKHIRDKSVCPALGKTCKKCGLKYHFAKMCKQALDKPYAAGTTSKKKVNAINENSYEYDSDSSSTEYISMVNVK